MSNFKRDLKKQPIPTKTSRGGQIVKACTGDAAIGDVTAELAAFDTANGKLQQTAMDITAAQAHLASLITRQAEDEAAWNAEFETLLVKIESNTRGDKMKMGGVPVPTYDRGGSNPAPAIGTVENLHAAIGTMPGEMKLTWDTLKPAPRMHIIRMCEDPYDESKMVQIGTASAAKFTAKKLTAGTRYWFQVAALGSGGQQGPWSDPAMGMAV